MNGTKLVGDPHGEEYPVIDGIPILLPDRRERELISSPSDAGAPAGTGIAFYNQSQRDDDYFRTSLGDTAETITRWLPERRTDGPTLEIGAGRGVLQGIGDDYTAFDYSFTALRRYIDPKFRRVCGTAERLPFRDNTFAFLFTVASLEHVPNTDLAFEEIDRVLKPSGVAFVAPAWHCVQYNCEGIPVRPYSDLSLRQKFVKMTLPIRRNTLAKAVQVLPGRLARRASWVLAGRRRTSLRFRRLKPDFDKFWTSDSDATSRLDAHEGCLFFHSRKYEILNPPPSARRQLLSGSISLVVRKPAVPAPSGR